MNIYGQIESPDNYVIYETEEFAPYLPNEWAKMPEFVTKGRLDTVTCYTAEEINSEVKVFHAGRAFIKTGRGDLLCRK